MVPKKIYYCWFGKGKKSNMLKKCYKSWERYYPDFEIIEINEDNFDINCNTYVKEAYENKKWAFVSDYARLKVLYDKGGIYFDTDVEALKRIDDNILESGYLAKEAEDLINTGLGFAVYPKNKIIKYMLDDYNDIHFIKDDGSFDLTTCPIRNTQSLVKRGYIIKEKNAKVDSINVYEPEYFCGWDLNIHKKNITKNTYTIHHYEASWVEPKRRRRNKIVWKITNIVGEDFYKKVRNVFKK